VNTRQRFLAVSATAALSAPWRSTAAQGTATVRVGMAPTDGITPLLYAIKTNAFKDAGLDVQLVVGNNGAAQMAALVGGSLDVAAAALMPILNAHVKGVPLRVIAGSTIYNPAAPIAGAFVATSSRFKSFGDLGGATVMTSTLHSLSELGVRILVEKNGGNPSTLKFIETPYSMMAAAIADQTADVAVLTEPALTIATRGGNLRSLGDQDAGIDPKGFLMAAFCSTPSYAERNQDVVSRFTRTLYRVTAYTNTHHADTVAMIAEFTKMEPDLVRRMGRQTLATTLNVKLMQPAIDVAAKYGYLDRWFDAKELLT